MVFVPLIGLLIGLAQGFPQTAPLCATTTVEIVAPTTTYTFKSTYVTTSHATEAKNLGTFTQVIGVSSTKTLETLSQTDTICTASDATPATATSTVYTAPGVFHAEFEDPGCTSTVYSTTSYGATYVYLPASQTSTFTQYTAFTQATVTSTSSGGTAYAIATATATSKKNCGSAISGSSPSATVTVTQDSRCQPSSLVSEYRGFGLEYASDTPLSGATFTTSTTDASQCCQLCAEADSCAASSWDIRTSTCKLEFPVDYSTGDLNCGEGLLAYYDAGPNHPMAPGTGLFIGVVCGSAEYGSAKPDDGS